MASPTSSQPCDRPTFGEFSVRLTPPGESYRCPVSTPSNFVQRHSRIRRTKPIMDVGFSQPPILNGRQQRSKGMALTRHSKTTVRSTAKVPLQVGNSLKYYFVDQQGDQKEDEHTNTHWLKALCSQPVDEILNKYRRKSDVKRTRIIWCKTFTTPGERSLLSAWENNDYFHSRNDRERDVRSAYFVGGGDSVRGESAAKRQTQSEPPLSRAHNLELVSGSVSPVSARRELRSPMDAEQRGKPDVHESLKTAGSPRRTVKEFLSNDPSSRMSCYVTQYFAPKGRGPVYAKVVESPETLPKLSCAHRIATMSKERYNVTVSPQIAIIPEDDDSRDPNLS